MSSQMCACRSISPGITVRPSASIVRTPDGGRSKLEGPPERLHRALGYRAGSSPSGVGSPTRPRFGLNAARHSKLLVTCTDGLGIWTWASNDEGCAAGELLRQLIPDLRIRVINVVNQCPSHCGIFGTRHENPGGAAHFRVSIAADPRLRKAHCGIVLGLVIATTSGQAASIPCFEPSSFRSC